MLPLSGRLRDQIDAWTEFLMQNVVEELST